MAVGKKKIVKIHGAVETDLKCLSYNEGAEGTPSFAVCNNYI